MDHEHLAVDDRGALRPTDQYKGELPLQLRTSGANVVIMDANRVEIVPFLPSDFTDREGVWMFSTLARCLSQYYEQPESLLSTERAHLGGRRVYGQNDAEIGLWFEPDNLPSEPTADESATKRYTPFSISGDLDPSFPDDPEARPNHELRVEDATETCWYRVDTAAGDAAYTRTPEDAVANVGAFVEAVRLAHERPGVFINRYES